MKTNRRASAAVPVATMWSAAALLGAAAHGQTITAVPPLAGGSIARLYAVNAGGTAAAGYSDNAGGQDVAIRWTNTGGTQSMGFLPGGVTNSYAQAIDNAGTTIAGYGDSGGQTRAFRWTTTGGYQILPYVASPTGFNRANGISGDGMVVTGVSGLGAGANGFTYFQSNGNSFNVCVGGGAGNGGLAVSNDGSTITGACGGGAIRRTYSPNSVLSGLSGVPGQQWAMGEAISADGGIVTGRYSPSTGGEFGFRHGLSVPGFVQALPHTPGGSAAMRPRAVSGDGSLIIGQVVDNVAGFTCFVWTPVRGSRLLSEHLTLRGINLTGWTLTDATGISTDGSAMCGNGIFNGNPVGWVVRGLTCNTLNGGPALTATGPCIGGSSTMGGFGYSFQNGTTPYFRWFRNGVEIIPGVQPSGSTIAVTNTPNLTITNQQFADAGNYQVAISAQGACEMVSAAPGYAFAGPSTITPVTHPGDTSACFGQSPSLFAAASSPSAITYKWQKLVSPPSTYANVNDGPTGNGSTYFGTGTTTFTILGAQAADSGKYRCVWSFSGCGPSQSVNSSAAQLTVVDSLPAIIGPFNTTGCPGDNDAFLSVTVNPCVGCTYQWQRYDPCPLVNCFNAINDGPTGNGGSYGGTSTPSLTLSGLYPGDFTDYRCRITMPCAGTVFSDPATISPEPAPSVNIPTGGTGCQGGTAALSVTATPPGGTYQWQKYVGPCFLCYQNLANGPTGNGGTYSGAQSPTLTINGLDFVDTVTTFRCIVTNSCGNASGASADGGFVLEESPLIQTNPVGGKVCANGSKTLSVGLFPGNYGTLSYQWWRYTVAGPIFAPVGNGTYVTGSIASGAATPALTISNFKAGDTGQYYCKVSGDCGFTFSSVVNVTHCPPDFNCDGAVTVADIFGFLSAWFAGNPSANFNGVGGINVQDIFDFLAAWFAGC